MNKKVGIIGIVVSILVISVLLLFLLPTKSTIVYSAVSKTSYLDENTQQDMKSLSADKVSVMHGTTDNMGEKVTTLLVTFPKTMPIKLKDVTYNENTDAIVINTTEASEDQCDSSVWVSFGDVFYPKNTTVYVDDELVNYDYKELTHSIVYDKKGFLKLFPIGS
ncbi:MAG: hypothetical protein IJ567_06510 [Lachnospiraceae bacterium]|nr:hypothetical protein [Lachnospiraceae bacterium]